MTATDFPALPRYRGHYLAIRRMGLQRARQLLEQHAATIAEISFRVGFGSPAYFTKSFREEFGILPSEVS